MTQQTLSSHPQLRPDVLLGATAETAQAIPRAQPRTRGPSAGGAARPARRFTRIEVPPKSPQHPGATIEGISSRSCINQRPSRCSIARTTSTAMDQPYAAADRRCCVPTSAAPPATNIRAPLTARNTTTWSNSRAMPKAEPRDSQITPCGLPHLAVLWPASRGAAAAGGLVVVLACRPLNRPDHPAVSRAASQISAAWVRLLTCSFCSSTCIWLRTVPSPMSGSTASPNANGRCWPGLSWR